MVMIPPHLTERVPSMLRLIRLFFLLPLLAAALCSCASKEAERGKSVYRQVPCRMIPPEPPTGKKSAASLADVFQKAKEQREDKRLKFSGCLTPDGSGFL